MRHRQIVALAVVVGMLGSSALAVGLARGLNVTDVNGNTVALKSVRIDYTSYSFTYTPDYERIGIRARQGEGAVIIDWDNIAKITITNQTTLAAEVTLQSGKIIPLELVPDAKGGLIGNSELGDFTISLHKVKTIEVLPAATVTLPNWEKEITAFEQSDRANPPPKGALLFIGASTIRQWTTLARDFPQYQVINRGFGGSQIADATRFAPRIIFPYAPRAIYLRSGGNDLWRGKSVEQVFADFKEFVATVQERLPDTDIIFVSLNPSIARWKQAAMTKSLNALVANFIKDQAHLRYIETYDLVLGADGQPLAELFMGDKLHFNAEGYQRLAARIAPDLPKSGTSNNARTVVGADATPQPEH